MPLIPSDTRSWGLRRATSQTAGVRARVSPMRLEHRGSARSVERGSDRGKAKRSQRARAPGPLIDSAGRGDGVQRAETPVQHYSADLVVHDDRRRPAVRGAEHELVDARNETVNDVREQLRWWLVVRGCPPVRRWQSPRSGCREALEARLRRIRSRSVFPLLGSVAAWPLCNPWGCGRWWRQDAELAARASRAKPPTR